MRIYKCLEKQVYKYGDFKLVPIRDQDKYEIMKWRNDQIRILRQNKPLTKEDQEKYFRTVIENLFIEDKPDQLLFSFLENDFLVGYGGLVHIDWESRNAEISFINSTERSLNKDFFIGDWKSYLKILKDIAKELNFIKIYTYAYDLRPNLYTALLGSNFVEEARLKKHISVNGNFHDVVIHTIFLSNLVFRRAEKSDVFTYFDWANDESVRKNAFNSEKIEFNSHEKWFNEKINSSSSLLLVALLNDKPIGQIRFDQVSDSTYEVDVSIDNSIRGQGLGVDIIRGGTDAMIKHNSSIQRIVAKIKKNNAASRKAFVSAGYKNLTANDPLFDTYYFDNENA